MRRGVPEIYGAIFRFEGQVSVFRSAGLQRGPCHRLLFPEPLPPEAVKLLLWIGDPLAARCYDALTGRVGERTLAADPHCAWCGAEADPPAAIDYAHFCAARRIARRPVVPVQTG